MEGGVSIGFAEKNVDSDGAQGNFLSGTTLEIFYSGRVEEKVLNGSTVKNVESDRGQENFLTGSTLEKFYSDRGEEGFSNGSAAKNVDSARTRKNVSRRSTFMFTFTFLILQQRFGFMRSLF